MTRETKIGLLVGLLFIIVIGILLSDHLTNANNPRPADLAAAGREAIKGFTTPGGAGTHVGETVPLENPILTSRVPIAADFVKPAPTGIIDVSVGLKQPADPLIIQGNNATGDVPKTIKPYLPGDLIPVDPGTSTLSLDGPRTGTLVAPPLIPAIGPVAVAAVVVAEKAAKEYKAVANDNVARMAKRFYGADTKANRDLIIKANPVLQKDPTRIVVGRLYIIPTKPGAPAATVDSTNPPLAAPDTTTVATSEKFYTVKEGDNLWKIARDQCHDSKAIDDIRKLNRDMLKNGDALKLGMRLKLPAPK